MPIFPIIAQFLAMVVSGLVFRALASIGFAYVAYTGISSLVESVDGYIKGLLSGLPHYVSAILGIAKVDVAINIIIAAVITRLLLAGMDKVTGTITSMAILNKAAG